MTHESRERVRIAYSKGGRQYDHVRLVDPRGRLLSEHDVRLFLDMLPDYQDGWTVLEAGAGTGRFTMPALDCGYRLIASDVNESQLDELRAKVADRGCTDRCEVRNEDIFNLSFDDEQFDFAFSFHVIPRFDTLEDQRAAILEVARTIKPGGKFFFNYRNRRSLLYGRFYRGHAATPKQVADILAEAGMRIVETRGKMVLNRKLLNSLPLFAGRIMAKIDAKMLRVRPHRAWDVFVLAEKTVQSP